MKRMKVTFVIALCLGLVFSAMFLFSGAPPATEDERTVNGWHIDKWNPEDMDEFVLLSGSFPYFSEDALMEFAALAMRGRAIGRSEPFFVENTFSGARTVFTDYTFAVYDILRGETDAHEIIVRVEGGITYEFTLVVDHVPNFQRGKEYLLFLSLPGGGPFDAPGYYYYILGGLQGVFPIEDSARDGHFANEGNIVFVQYDELGKVFEISELYARLEDVNRTVPIRSLEDWRAEGIENLRASVANGVFNLTEEEIYEIMNVPFFSAQIVS